MAGHCAALVSGVNDAVEVFDSDPAVFFSIPPVTVLRRLVKPRRR